MVVFSRAGFEDIQKYVVPYLTAEFMSEDEDVEKKHPRVFLIYYFECFSTQLKHTQVFHIFSSDWMSPALRTIFRAADHIVRYEWSHDMGSRTRGGNDPRERKAVGITKKAAAPSGLPRCCYDNTWYNALRESDRRALGATDIQCNLQIPQNLAYMFTGVTISST